MGEQLTVQLCRNSAKLSQVSSRSPGSVSQKQPPGRLADHLEQTGAGLVLDVARPAGKKALRAADVPDLGRRLAEAAPRSPLEEARLQNRRTLTALDEARRARDELEQTNRLLTEEVARRQQAECELARVNEALGAYAHTVSHDLKGPLAGAMGASQVLVRMLDRPVSEEAAADLRELAGVFEGSVRRAVQLIDNLLTLAETRCPEAVAPVDVGEVMQQVLADRSALLRAQGIAVEVAPGLGQVRLAPAHLYQLLANLVDNAVKHGRGDPPVIRVRRLADADGLHRLQVRDNGPGVPEHLLGTLFDEFVRGTGGGSGIGLATVRKIARARGGDVTVHNDGGACFLVTLGDPG